MSTRLTPEQYKKVIEQTCFDFFEYMLGTFPDLCDNMALEEWDDQFIAFLGEMRETR